MVTEFQQLLPSVLPAVVHWCEQREAEVLRYGSQLNATEIAVARRVGVARPELIRVAVVERIPVPTDPELRALAAQVRLLGPHTDGLTLGYAVYILAGHESMRLLAHEFRHVYQYEQAGSIAAFLAVYLRQIAETGYEHAPLEMDARAAETEY